jgi:hypothetical protein
MRAWCAAIEGELLITNTRSTSRLRERSAVTCFTSADRLDSDRDGVLHAEVRVGLIHRVIAETILADEARVGRIGEQAGGAVEPGGAVPGRRLGRRGT